MNNNIKIINRLSAYKSKLAATDYKVLKYIEGYISEEDYAKIKIEREELRVKIRELEQQIKPKCL